MDALDFDPRNPLRPPAWRWFRAQALVATTRRRGRREDPEVRRGWRFLRAVRRSGGDVKHPRVRRIDPALHEAVMLLQEGGERRCEVEARLLAGQDDAAIAAAVELSCAVVAAYGSICFDVRSRLGASDWIMAIILGPRINYPAAPLDLATVWKSCGYHLGPLVLDRLVALHRRGTAGGPASPASGNAVDPTALLVSVMMLPDDERSGPQIVRLANSIDALDRLAAARAATPVFAPLMGRTLDRDVLSRPAGDQDRVLDARGGSETGIPRDPDDDRERMMPFAPLRWPVVTASELMAQREVG